MTARIIVASIAVALAAIPADARQAAPRVDVQYVPSPPEVVKAMLDLAQVTKADVVYDLGCGDGRIPIAAAKQFGARAVGIDIDPARIKEARQNAEEAGVADKVTFLNEDLFTADISNATVVTLYLLPSLNQKLLPRLNQVLKPGTRVVSHAFDMGSIKARRTLDVGGRPVFLFVTPIR